MAVWTPRVDHAGTALGGYIYIMGGSDADGVRLNDVWRSTDGANWTQLTAAAGWSQRVDHDHAVVIFNNAMFLMGGHATGDVKKNDVWSSADGITWTEKTSAAAWSGRHNHAAQVFNSKLFVLGGRDATPIRLNDVWSSTDGITWTQETPDTQSLGAAVADDLDVGQTIETTQANNATTNDMSLFPASPANFDSYYFGYSSPFGKITLNIGQAGAGTWSITWQYYDGAAWSAANATDNTNGFRNAGSNTVTFTIPGNWAKTSVASVNFYYVRARITSFTSMTTRPLGTQAWVTPLWAERLDHEACVLGSAMFLIGGDASGNIPMRDVWKTTDGKNWTLITDNASWPARRSSRVIVFNNKLWLIGGDNGSGTRYNDVWSSADGITWVQETAAAAWSARTVFSSLIFNNRMWVFGGTDGSRLNDAWYSTNGSDWVNVTTSGTAQLTQKFLDEFKKGMSISNTVIEIALSSGAVKWGTHMAGFSDITPLLQSVSSLQNKLDTKSGFSTRGQITFSITGRDNFKSLLSGEYLKNRRVVVKQGFIAQDFAYSDYAEVFAGRVTDWSRKGDELTITASDDMVDATKKIPEENSTKTQYADYRNMNPVDIMKDILLIKLGIGTAYVDESAFDTERDNWLNGWKFDRVITEPKEARDYLDELQIETNSFLVHDGTRIIFKVFAPPVPGQSIEEWTDNANIRPRSFSEKSGYKDNFFNRVVLYYDYDESGSDNEENFESPLIAFDAASQGSTQWDEVKTKTIKSKWLRSYTYTQPVNITGVIIYHVSLANGAGTGYLTYNYTNNTLQWTAPGGTIGEAVKLAKDGKAQVFSSDKTKWARVVVTTASLPTSNKSDAIAITALNGLQYATDIAQKLLNRYRDPVATVAFEVDTNNSAWASKFIKPTDIKDITTDEACMKGGSTWSKERVMLTSVRPEKNKVSIEAIQTKMYRRYGFIAPAGTPDYDSATAEQKQYAFIGDDNNKVGAALEDGYYIW